MKEVEVKYRVPDAAVVESGLKELGLELSQAVRQDDQAYAKRGWSYGMSKIGVSFARLRTQDGVHLFTVKRPVDNEQSCIEYECEVSDREAMHNAILTMGFYPTIRIVKLRRVAVYRDYSICLDEVEGAGTFFEVESLVPQSRSAVAVQRELEWFVDSLGIGGERTTQTYDSLIREVQSSQSSRRERQRPERQGGDILYRAES
ncbi:MAG: class IV adenylate cyclase [Egibacteraceae bacterium]